MATESAVIKIGTMNAAADLRGYQYRGVKVSGSRTVGAVVAATDPSIGVLQNKPNTGEAAEIHILGESIVQAGTNTIAAGDELAFNPSGQAVTAAANAGNTIVWGRALEASTAVGALISCLIYGQVRRI